MKKILLKTINLTLIGLIIGVIIALYKYAITLIISLSDTLLINSSIYTKALMIIPIFILIMIAHYLTKVDTNIKGTGMPNIEAYILNHNKNFKWQTSLPFMFINSLISVFCGMPIGTEAPSVFMGGTIGVAACKKSEDKDYIYAGLAGGFSAAFLNPLAGLFYVIEETIHKYKLKQIIKVSFVCIIACFTSFLINKEEIIHLSINSSLNFKNYYIILIVLITNSILSFLLIKTISYLKQKIVKNPNIFIIKYRFFICYIIFLIILFAYPLLSGSGIKLVNYIQNSPIWYSILLFLIVRLIMFIFSNTSTITGGQLVPTLILGALNGYIWANVFSLQAAEYNIIVIISMTSIFALINKTPITSFLLVFTISNYNFNILIPAIISLLYNFIFIKFVKYNNIVDSKRHITHKHQ